MFDPSWPFGAGRGCGAGSCSPRDQGGSRLALVAEIALGPLGGAFVGRHGARRLPVLLSLAAAVCLAIVGVGLLWSGAVLVMPLRGLMQPLPAPVAAADNPGPTRAPTLAKMATWRDLGAGAGPLLAGLLLPVLPASLLY